MIEDAATQKTALQFRYFTVTRGSENRRHASVHRVVLGPPARFVATCHRTGALKWFRVESVSDAKLDPHEKFRDADRLRNAVTLHHPANRASKRSGGTPRSR